MKLTRELRVWLSSDSAAYAQPAQNSWSGWPVVDRIVPHVVVRATLLGPTDPRTGFLCNVKQIDDLVRERVHGQLTGDTKAAILEPRLGLQPVAVFSNEVASG